MTNPNNPTSFEKKIEEVLFQYTRDCLQEAPYATDKPRKKAIEAISNLVEEEVKRAIKKAEHDDDDFSPICNDCGLKYEESDTYCPTRLAELRKEE